MSCRKDQHFTHIVHGLTRQRINNRDSFNGVAKHFDSCDCLVISGLHFNGVAANAEVSTTKSHVVAIVLQVDKSTKQTALVVINPNVEFQKVSPILLWVTHSVDATDRSNNDGVPTRKQSSSC